MQFVLMMYGSAVLITELQRKYPEHDLTNLGQKTYEVIFNNAISVYCILDKLPLLTSGTFQVLS